MIEAFANSINSFLVIIIFGSLILLSFLLVTNTLKVNKKANLVFGIFLFLWSTFWLEEIFVFANTEFIGASTMVALRLMQFFTPILFYYGTVYYTNPDFKFGKVDIKYLVFPVVYLIGLILNLGEEKDTLIPIILNVLIIVQALYFTSLSYIRIKEHKKKINLFASNTIEIDLRWLEYIIISLLAMSIFIGVYNAIFQSADLNLFANLFSLCIIYFVAINSIRQKEIFALDKDQRSKIIETSESISPEKRKLISNEDLEMLKQKLIEVMDSQQPFLDPELSLLQLASIVDITPHQLSYLINEGFNQNFFTFVNTYRVEKVKEYLLDNEKKNLAILGIAFESGFNSKTSFYTTFKKIASMTPSEFLKKSSGL